MRTLLLATVLSMLPLAAQSQPDQSQPDRAAPSAGCPVEFTSAAYHRHATPQPMPDPNATTQDKAYGTLEFAYRNAAGKPVSSFHVAAEFASPAAVKPPLLKNDPRSTMHFIQGDPLPIGDASHASYEISRDVTGLTWLRLDSVEFQDGSTWDRSKGAAEGQCTFYPKAALVPAGR
jgi:hypothetical protein